MTVRIKEIASTIADEHQITKTDSKALVETVFASIADAAEQGMEIWINGFGKFKVKDMPARVVRNPQTGEPIQVPARRKLVFIPSKPLKDKLAGQDGPATG